MLGRPYFTVQNSVYCWPGGACWAAGQCGAQGPVMCGAGLPVWCWGGGNVDADGFARVLRLLALG